MQTFEKTFYDEIFLSTREMFLNFSIEGGEASNKKAFENFSLGGRFFFKKLKDAVRSIVA